MVILTIIILVHGEKEECEPCHIHELRFLNIIDHLQTICDFCPTVQDDSLSSHKTATSNPAKNKIVLQLDKILLLRDIGNPVDSAETPERFGNIVAKQKLPVL